MTNILHKTIEVKTNNTQYPIIIGKNSLHKLEEFIKDSKKYSKIFIITDENVYKLHFTKLNNIINKINIASHYLITEASEKSKSFNNLEKICEEIISLNPDRKSLIIAFGGGVVGDLSGFIASILLRGIDFIQLPTTLLASVDSSVGGKTAINSKFGKNLIGSFYQPKLVICDTNLLSTLPIRDLKSGYAEVLKYGLISDKIFFHFLEENYHKIFSLEEEILKEIIFKSCEIKARIVEIDEKEQNIRALLNFGHSFGHLFETETNYSNEILHGEAVALGMAMASKMSLNFNLINIDEYQQIIKHLKIAGFIIEPKKIRNVWSIENLTSSLYRDKKVENNSLTFILLESIGKAIIKKNVNIGHFQQVMNDFLN